MNTPEFDLSQLDEQFTTAKAPDNEVPAGRYNVNVEKVEIKPTKNKEPRLSWQLKILNGEHAGRMIFLGHMLSPCDTPDKTAQRLGYLKKDLALCGLNIAKLSELPGQLASLLDIKLAVRVVVKDNAATGEKNTNVYLDKKLDPNGIVDESTSFPGGSAGGDSVAQANALFGGDLPKFG